MDFIEKLEILSSKIKKIGLSLQTEEATKNALIMPFLQSVLGYDVFDPSEVIPEYTADTVTKKGEKVDYAILKEGKVQIIIECKKFGEILKEKHIGQLFRYFSVTHARIAILTNGSVYSFYTDLDYANKMDEKPFLVLDLENIDEYMVPEVKKLTKTAFDVDSIVGAAGELKYLSQIKKLIESQFAEPEDDFVKFFASRIYEGQLSPKVKNQFSILTRKALQQFLSESINVRLKNALTDVKTDSNNNSISEINDSNNLENHESVDDKIITTQDEIDGFNVIKAILRKNFSIDRIIGRDTQSYFGVLLDNNNRKPLCRLRFNSKQKYLVILDDTKKELKHAIDSIDQIYDFSEQLIKSTSHFE